MSKSNKNPGAPASAHRVQNIVALASTSDPQTDTLNARETPAVRALARRLGLPITTALVICELAGIGGVK
jgi:hypothetical protein